MFGCRERTPEQPGEVIAIPVTFKDGFGPFNSDYGGLSQEYSLINTSSSIWRKNDLLRYYKVTHKIEYDIYQKGQVGDGIRVGEFLDIDFSGETYRYQNLGFDEYNCWMAPLMQTTHPRILQSVRGPQKLSIGPHDKSRGHRTNRWRCQWRACAVLVRFGLWDGDFHRSLGDDAASAQQDYRRRQKQPTSSASNGQPGFDQIYRGRF